MDLNRRLYKNKAQGKVCGVCAGLAEYFNVDVTLLRVAAILLIFAAGTGILAYFVCAIIMPDKSDLYNNF